MKKIPKIFTVEFSKEELVKIALEQVGINSSSYTATIDVETTDHPYDDFRAIQIRFQQVK